MMTTEMATEEMEEVTVMVTEVELLEEETNEIV